MPDRWIYCFDGVLSAMLFGPHHQAGPRDVGKWLGAFDRGPKLDSVETWKSKDGDRNLPGFEVDLGRLLAELWRTGLELISASVPQATVSVHLSEKKFSTRSITSATEAVSTSIELA